MSQDLRSGMLHKKGGLRWQKRWFVLTQSGTNPARLAYFRERNDSNGPRATLELSSKTKIDLLPGTTHGFQVIMQGRALKVYAESADDRESWMRALRDAIAIAISQTLVHAFGQDWFIDPKYKLLKKIGSGAYGFVASADDTSAGRKCAIKKVANAFEDMVDAKRILREIRLMRQFDHPNVVRLYDVMEPPYIEDFEDLYIVTDLMSTDLQKILYSKTQLSTEQLQYLLYQLLCGMNYISSASVLHRDLKPSNLLIDIQSCNLQVCDFGLARGVAPADELQDEDGNPVNPSDGGPGTAAEQQEMTEYVVTRWYRAPEIMLGYHQYDKAIDMWSIGCIFGEMLQQNPVFAGSDYIDQLKRISKLLGRPRSEDLWFVTNQNALNFMLQLPDYPPVPLAEKFPSHSEAAIDLLSRMLVLNPAKRITLAEAIPHPYVCEFHDERAEAVAGFSVEMADIEELKLTKSNIQRMMYEEVRAFSKQRDAAQAEAAAALPSVR